MKLVIIMLLMSICRFSYACTLQKNSTFFWNDQALIDGTSNILWVKVVKIEPLKKLDTEYKAKAKYTFSVLKVLKGNFDKKNFTSENFSSPPEKVSRLKSPHRDGFKGRSFYAPDCELYEYGELNKNYLLFVDAFHPKFFEEVPSENDDWFKKVYSLIHK